MTKPKKTTGDNVPAGTPDNMMHASVRASASSARGYFYGGNFGDSIETRLPDGGFLGGGNDYFDGRLGTGNSWIAQSPGTYGGTGLMNGVGRMFSSIHSGSAGGFQYLRNFASNSSFNHAIIAACQAAYFQSGIVQSVIDLYADFSTEDLQIYHPDKSVQNFYKVWAQKVNLEDRIHDAFVQLFTSANTFVYRTWATLGNSDKRAMQRAESSQNIDKNVTVRINGKDKTLNPNIISNNSLNILNKEIAAIPPTIVEENLPDNSDKQIPWGYTFLNPLQMDVRGSRIQNKHYWVMLLDKKDTKDLIQTMTGGNKVDFSETKINIPKGLQGKLGAAKKNSGYYMELTLDKNELSVIQRPGKYDWFAWGVPFIYPALKPLMFKDSLRNMESAIAHAATKIFYLFKLGNLKDGFVPEPDHYERLSDMIQVNSNVGYLLWNNLIEGQVLQPDLQNVFDDKKHQSAKEDILLALGVPEVLIGGKGSNFSNAYIAVAGVLEKLESYRNKVKDWLMGELKIIADAMGFRRLPEVKFGRTSLTDEKSRHQFLLGLYDRNIISAETLLTESETTLEVEETRKKLEQDLTKPGGIMERKGPYDKQDVSNINGRPPGSSTGPTGKQENQRKPKGINLAHYLEAYDQLNERARGWLDQIEEFCSKRMLKQFAKAYPDPYGRIKHVKELKKEDRDRLEQLIYNVFTNFPTDYENDYIDYEVIINLLQSNAAEGLKKEVSKLYHDKIMDYHKKFGKMPSLSERRRMISAAYTQYAIQNLEY